MAHSIYVRQYDGGKAHPPSLLAHEISDLAQAEMIVHKIASSYPDHGVVTDTKIHWFLDSNKLHEIYARPS